MGDSARDRIGPQLAGQNAYLAFRLFEPKDDLGIRQSSDPLVQRECTDEDAFLADGDPYIRDYESA